MIKVTFIEPQEFTDIDGNLFEALFLFGRFITYPFGKMLLVSDSPQYLNNFRIKSIEHVKPTEL